MFKSKAGRMYVSRFWPEGCGKISRDMKGIKKYYDEFADGEYGVVDDQSFSDLTLDTLYKEMDGTYSSAGESKLYEMLRRPVRDKKVLDDRSDFMEYFSQNEEDRVNVQSILYDLSNDKKFNFIELLINEYEGNSFKKITYFILGKVLPIVFFVAGFFYSGMFAMLGALIILNSIIAAIENGTNSNKPYQGICYATKLIKCGKNISKLKIEKLHPYQLRIKKVMDNLGADSKNLKAVSVISSDITDFSILDPILEIAGNIFLRTDNAYYSMIEKLNKHQESLRELYSVIGEIDALIAVQGYKEKSQYSSVKPEFEKECGFEIVDGAHPLVKDVVKNSISIDNKGIVLTGTNMSGKSTFLRMVGLNIILAQSFNFVHAKKYKSDFLNFVSSISPEDDITTGKSYYVAEAEAVLRIIKALDGEYKVFCCIDEIFRGTNPIERIAASEEILKYIQARNSLSIVATHDKELTDLLYKTHDFYHFSEDVNESKGLTFDYKLKKGVLQTRNAIKLLKYIGYPDEIVNGAFAAVRLK